jgi:hypothetical protein
MIKNIRHSGFLSVIEEENDAFEPMLTFEYAGNMGANLDNVDECLGWLGMAPISFWKGVYSVWEEKGSPDYFYTISFYL